jgi:LCP family protein required for cell wall assembly
MKKQRRSKGFAIISTLALVVLLIVGGVWFLSDWIGDARATVPPQRTRPDGDDFLHNVDLGDEPLDRGMGKFTFLIFGANEGLTDTILVGTVDTDNSTFEIVSIPRDTMVNVGWGTRKANSIYANMRHSHRDEPEPEVRAMEETVRRFGDVLGFMVDYWAIIDYEAFVTLVDAIGGVEYDVPMDMYHSGRTITAGLQTLSGEDALHVVRFRGFPTADIGRIESQQDFLMTMASQILANRDSIRIRNLAQTFLRHTVTDISLQNLIWFGERFLELEYEDINFHIMPGNYWGHVGGVSYVTIYVDEWIELINTYINPWDFDLTIDNFSILTRDAGGGLFVTDGNWQGDQNWGR